jgi:hypothetical protein
MTRTEKIQKAKDLLRSEGYHIMDTEPYCYWSVLDVEDMLDRFHEEDKFTDISYTEDLGKAVMDLIERRFDAEYGVTWDNIEYTTEEILNTLKH